MCRGVLRTGNAERRHPVVPGGPDARAQFSRSVQQPRKRTAGGESNGRGDAVLHDVHSASAEISSEWGGWPRIANRPPSGRVSAGTATQRCLQQPWRHIKDAGAALCSRKSLASWVPITHPLVRNSAVEFRASKQVVQLFRLK